MDKQITHYKSVNEKLAHEIMLLKRFKFAKRSEQLSPDQASLLDDLIDTDIAAIEVELKALQPTTVEAKMRQQPKRAALQPQFPRTLIHPEPDNGHCQCGCALKRIGEDASEKLDYSPGVFTVEHHIRGEMSL
jgi:transposase